MARSLLSWIALLGCVACGPNRARDMTGRLVTARSTGESAPAAVVTVAFKNHSGDAIEVQEYRVQWPGGTFTPEARELRVPPHAEVERTARLDSRSGDIAALLSRPHDVTIEILRARAR